MFDIKSAHRFIFIAGKLFPNLDFRFQISTVKLQK